MSIQNSIVIVNFNGREKLARLLTAVDPSQSPGTEVIVVDSASFDGSAEMIEREFAARRGVRLLPMSSNRGFAAAANAGVNEARGDVIVVAHADVVATAHDFGELADQLREARGRRAAAVLPRLRGADGLPQAFVARLPKLSTGVVGAFGGARLARRAAVPTLDHVADHEYAGFACCAFDADLLASLGSFDAGYFLYFADADLCARMHAKDYRLLISRDVVVEHSGAAPGAALPENRRRIMRKDLARFFQKQRPGWEQAVVGWADTTRRLVTRET
jgi:GT2 family glycosyltransferase